VGRFSHYGTQSSKEGAAAQRLSGTVDREEAKRLQIYKGREKENVPKHRRRRRRRKNDVTRCNKSNNGAIDTKEMCKLFGWIFNGVLPTV
jgi:hypothetical protein